MKEIIYKKILVPHDGSKLANASLPHVVALAKVSKASVLLVHVVNSVEQELINLSLPNMHTPAMVMRNSIEEGVEANKKKAHKQLEEIKKTLHELGVMDVNTAVEEGRVEDKILEVADNQHSDLIVMSTHGRSGVGRVLLGSVAEHIVRHSSYPVLLIRPERR